MSIYYLLGLISTDILYFLGVILYVYDSVLFTGGIAIASEAGTANENGLYSASISNPTITVKQF